MCPGTHTSSILLCSASFTRDWWQSLTNLDFIWKLLRALMDAWLSQRIQDFPTYVALFCILIIQALIANISTWNTVMWSPRLTLCPSWAPSIHPSTIAFIGLGPSVLPDQALFVVWFEPFLPLTLSRNMTVKSNLVNGPRGLGARQCFLNQMVLSLRYIYIYIYADFVVSD